MNAKKLETLKAAIAYLEKRLTELDPSNEWYSSVKLQLEIRQDRLAKVGA